MRKRHRARTKSKSNTKASHGPHRVLVGIPKPAMAERVAFLHIRTGTVQWTTRLVYCLSLESTVHSTGPRCTVICLDDNSQFHSCSYLELPCNFNIHPNCKASSHSNAMINLPKSMISIVSKQSHDSLNVIRLSYAHRGDGGQAGYPWTG